MTTCPTCSNPVAAGAGVCSHCGASMAAVSGPDGSPTTPAASPWAQPGGESVAAPPVGPPMQAPTGPPTAEPAPSPDAFDLATAPGDVEESSGGSPVGKIVGIAVAVVAVAALGWLLVRLLGGGEGSGGSDSPEQLAQDMVDAIAEQDGLAFVDLIAPDEFDGIGDIVDTAADRFGEFEESFADAEADELDVSIDVELDDVDVDMQGDSAAIVSFDVSGDIEIGANELFGDEALDERFDSRDLPDDVILTEMIAVRLDDRWYLSPMLTVGHLVVENGGLPRGDYDAIGTDRPGGGDSPEDAVRAFFDAVNDPDAEDLAGAVGGGEGRLLTVFEDALDDALRDVDTSSLPYEFTVETDDLGSGRVELTEIRLDVDDEFDPGTLTVEDGCFSLRTVELSERGCLEDVALFDDVDTTIWLDTVEEGGAHRVRIVPTFLDVIDRFLGVGEVDEFLYAIDQAFLDDPAEVDVDTDVEITFDGELYVVHEFEIEGGEWYRVASSNPDIVPELYVDDGFGFSEWYFADEPFQAFDDGTVRVVTPSESPDGEIPCDGITCVPSRDGETTLRIRQGVRQSVDFPAIVSGDLGPSDLVVLELEVSSSDAVRIDIEGGAEFDDRELFVYETDFDSGVYELPPAVELPVFNPDATETTTYRIVPSPGG